MTGTTEYRDPDSFYSTHNLFVTPDFLDKDTAEQHLLLNKLHIFHPERCDQDFGVCHIVATTPVMPKDCGACWELETALPPNKATLVQVTFVVGPRLWQSCNGKPDYRRPRVYSKPGPDMEPCFRVPLAHPLKPYHGFLSDDTEKAIQDKGATVVYWEANSNELQYYRPCDPLATTPPDTKPSAATCRAVLESMGSLEDELKLAFCCTDLISGKVVLWKRKHTEYMQLGEIMKREKAPWTDFLVHLFSLLLKELQLQDYRLKMPCSLCPRAPTEKSELRKRLKLLQLFKSGLEAFEHLLRHYFRAGDSAAALVDMVVKDIEQQ